MARHRQHRRRIVDDANHHDRWIISYADFITLLFAFFVVMYSISSINKSKYDSLSSSLESAFSSKRTSGADPNKGADKSQEADKNSPIAVVADTKERRELSDGILKERERLKQVTGQLENALGGFIGDNQVSVTRNDYWIELAMSSELLFLSGEAELSAKALPVLKKIAEVINPLQNAVNVEGHTDNIPINTLKFPSNWDLSSARATSVVQALVHEGVNPTRLSAVGYGEFHPIADNGVDDGRFKNRRVTLVIMSQAFSRYGASDEERAKLLNLAPTAAAKTPPPVEGP